MIAGVGKMQILGVIKMDDIEMSPQELALWWCNLSSTAEDRVEYDTFRKMTGACYYAFDYVTRAIGYNPAIDQYWFRVNLSRDADINAALVELGWFLPYIKSCDGYKAISVFEYTLSEYGCFELREYAEDDILLVKTVYGNERTEARFNSWYDAFSYVRMNHWYGDSEGD